MITPTAYEDILLLLFNVFPYRGPITLHRFIGVNTNSPPSVAESGDVKMWPGKHTRRTAWSALLPSLPGCKCPAAAPRCSPTCEGLWLRWRTGGSTGALAGTGARSAAAAAHRSGRTQTTGDTLAPATVEMKAPPKNVGTWCKNILVLTWHLKHNKILSLVGWLTY